MPKPSKPPKSRSRRPPSPPPSPLASPPPTFTTPSPSLLRLLSTLPHPHIYILSLDHTPPSHRLLLFSILLIFNTILALLLLYRFYIALPTYLALILPIFGYPTPTTTTAATSSKEIIQLVIYRMSMFFLDGIVLGRWIAEWPYNFFLNGCLAWRLRIGLPPAGREIIVRRSRRWAEQPSLGIVEGREWWNEDPSQDQKVIWDHIREACKRDAVEGKSALQLGARDWELWAQGMVDGHFLLGKGEVGWEELEGGPVVGVWGRERGWCVWRPWGEEEEKEGKAGGEKLRLFKDLLTAMGKEGLFFRWVEVMQDERGGDGEEGFARERRQRAVGRSRKLFEEQGLDWDLVMDGVGGVDGLLGMEVAG
ncbi:MAG: hypothetical protein Q9184_004209 [Pyrenodesmia sp. 2 TL-2023]